MLRRVQSKPLLVFGYIPRSIFETKSTIGAIPGYSLSEHKILLTSVLPFYSGAGIKQRNVGTSTTYAETEERLEKF